MVTDKLVRFFKKTITVAVKNPGPGSPLAVRMVHLMLASLLHRFHWSLPTDVENNGLDMDERLGLNLAMATPLQAIATPV